MTERDDKRTRTALSEVEGRPATPPRPTLPLRHGFGAQVASRGRRLLRHALVFITLVIVVDAIAGEKGLLALLEARREYAALERSLARARAENAELRETARRLREDPAAIEEAARRELGLIKPGEVLVIVKEITNNK
jgi:cell division protein FtsB